MRLEYFPLEFINRAVSVNYANAEITLDNGVVLYGQEAASYFDGWINHGFLNDRLNENREPPVFIDDGEE